MTDSTNPDPEHTPGTIPVDEADVNDTADIARMLAELITADMLRQAGLSRLANEHAETASEMAESLDRCQRLSHTDVAVLYRHARQAILDRFDKRVGAPEALIGGVTDWMLNTAAYGFVAGRKHQEVFPSLRADEPVGDSDNEDGASD